MRVFNSIEEAEGIIKNAVVTTGAFDGVHLGHKVIIKRLNHIALEIGGESVLITFHPHPRKILYPEKKGLNLINSRREKIQLLEKTGLDNLIIHPFSLEFSRTSSFDFIKNYLVSKLDLKVIIIGPNHQFGHNREGDYSQLLQLGNDFKFNVEEIPLKDIENEVVSSGKVRKAIESGNFEKANLYLGYDYSINGELSAESVIGKIKKHTAFDIMLEEPDKMLPPPGIYSAKILNDINKFEVFAIISINDRGCANVSIALSDSEKLKSGEFTTLFFEKRLGEFPKSMNDIFY
jgi:riboflavin kinase / FMN adenylyltransferase